MTIYLHNADIRAANQANYFHFFAHGEVSGIKAREISKRLTPLPGCFACDRVDIDVWYTIASSQYIFLDFIRTV